MSSTHDTHDVRDDVAPMRMPALGRGQVEPPGALGADAGAEPPALESTLDLPVLQKAHPRLVLPIGGLAPPRQKLDTETANAAFHRIAEVRSSLGSLAAAPRRPSVLTVTPVERFRAVCRRLHSHHGIIPMFGLIGYALDEACAREGHTSCGWWYSRASAMRRGTGALCLYGVDFEPCPTLYASEIRRFMPEGFTGFEIREREYALEPAISRFRRTFAPVTPPRAAWTAANERYHELHTRCMYRAVPDGISLSAKYLQEHGRRPPISAAAFDQYDAWFAIDRASITRLDFSLQVLEVVDRLIGDICNGHRLDPDVVDDIGRGFLAVTDVLAAWQDDSAPHLSGSRARIGWESPRTSIPVASPVDTTAAAKGRTR